MIDLHLSAFAPRWRFLYAVRIDAYEAYTSAYQSFMEDLSFDVTTCVNVALSSGEVILNDKRNQRIIAERIMEELRKQIGSKMTFSI